MLLSRTVPALGAVFLSCSANACTVCDSPTGHQLRAGLFNGHFLRTLTIVAAPAPVLVLAVLLLYVAMPDLSLPPSTAAREQQLAPAAPETCP